MLEWSNVWQLSTSIPKCSAIDFSTGKKCTALSPNLINGNELKLLNESNDLGVIFDNKLQFTPHISPLVSRAKQRLFLHLSSFRMRQHGPLLLAYKSYILPLINCLVTL